MYFVSADFSDWAEHISFIIRVTWGILVFRPILFGNIWWSRKGPRILFLLGVSFYSFEVDGCGVACSSGEAAWDPVGVLPSVSSFFSAFSIFALCVSSLFMAAPRCSPSALMSKY